MIKDNLGDRMKNNYESITNYRLTRRMPVIIRIDGCHFHTFTRHFKRPFDDVLITAMQRTTKKLVEEIQGCKFGYTQSDEISLLLTDYDTFTTDAWFNYELRKLTSVSASIATMYFNKEFEKAVNEFQLSNSEYHEISSYLKAIDTGAYFDARAFNVPIEEVTNYFYWRQLDASRNSVQMLARSKYSHKMLEGKSNSEVQDMLMNDFKINWNNESTVHKRGTSVYKVGDKVIIDTNMPILKGEDRSHVGKHFILNEE